MKQETIIEMEADATGIFQPVRKITVPKVKKPVQPKAKALPSPAKMQEHEHTVEQLVTGINMGINLFNQFKRMVR